jgi:mono/diheme cytochrome c family protein
VRNLITACCALTVLAGWLIIQTPAHSAIATAPLTANQQTPAALFSKHCATCHGKDGRAKTFKAKFNHARNLTEPGWQDAVSDERISNSITNGRGKMPSFAKKLSEAEIDSLILIVRGLKRG